MFLAEEPFFSIQGEGSNWGLSQIFIRVAGCSVKCKFCDSKMSWGTGTEYNVEAIIKELRNLPKCEWVSITGGEPLEQRSELANLISALHKLRYKVEIETSGSQLIVPQWPVITWVVDFKMPSAEAKLPFIYENLNLLQVGDAIKCVVSDENDLVYMKGILPTLSCSLATVFVQPEWSKGIEWTKEVAKFAMQNEVRLSMQMHKILGLR